ncbi:MAG: hypothetical protein ACP5RC_06660 [Halothiobacillaceae bacterium]
MLTFFPPTRSRGDAIAAGFRFGHVGTHTSRTIMLDELTAVLAAVPFNGKPDEYLAAIVEENCLGKQTVSTRRLTLQRLRELYALDPAVPLFRILRRLWDVDEQGRPLLALLASLARDPLLLATADVVLSLPDGAEFQRTAMREVLAKAVEDRLNESTLNKVVRNAASSWTQSGHLEGRTFKFRRQVRPSPAAVALALYLAHAAGLAVEESLSSGWIKVLDCSASTALELATAAKRLGLVDLRMAGDVIDLNLDRLDPAYAAAPQTR